jgi:cobaltochelatase CobN
MILVVTNADTEVLTWRVAAESLGWPPGELQVARCEDLTLPSERSRMDAFLSDLAGTGGILVRILGGKQAWPYLEELSLACRRLSVPLVVLSGEMGRDPEMEAFSNVPLEITERARAHMAQGGPENLAAVAELIRSWAKSPAGSSAKQVLSGAREVLVLGEEGIYRESAGKDGPLIGVVFYRAHLVAGNTFFIDDLCDAIEALGARAVAVWCYSLRSGSVASLLEQAGVDAVITTVLAGGSGVPDGQVDGPGMQGTMSSGQWAEWDPGSLAKLRVPVIQGIVSTSTREQWEGSFGGLSPLDAAWQVALPELDGRIVATAFSFKEPVDDGEMIGSQVKAYRTVADRVERVAEVAVSHALLGKLPPERKRVAIVLSAYPTKRARLGNAVALDTPASALVLLEAMAEQGYRITRSFASGDELMAELADGLNYDTGSPANSAEPTWRLPIEDYLSWFDTLEETFREKMVASWGDPPGQVSVSGGCFQFCGVDLGNVIIAVQPPRGFAADEIALYHSPEVPPTHHYLAFYLWLRESFGAHCLLHLGKHGTLEWLPGKALALSSGCAPDAAIAGLPLVYPFVVNDPGEGTQAKRRAHAVIVDHLTAPMTRAESYGAIQELEGLLDEHAKYLALDPSKLPGLRKQISDCLISAEMHRDLGHALDPEDPSFDDWLIEVDGYLCELKDAQIRGGLHVLGKPPTGREELDMLLAMSRIPGTKRISLRDAVARALGAAPLSQGGPGSATGPGSQGGPSAVSRAELDEVETASRALLGLMQEFDFSDLPSPEVPELERLMEDPQVREALEWIRSDVVVRLRACEREVTSVLDALSGKAVDAGPSGAPTRGMTQVLPTGRNFYSLDPRCVPTPLSWEVGQRLAEQLCSSHEKAHGRALKSVGMVVWGTSAMRTGGDDVAEALALMGVRPQWEEGSGRVAGLEVIPLEELARPRVEVTLRVSGFFRDAFPSLVNLVDEAARMVSRLEEPEELNPLRLSGPEEPRVFGPRPGSYGSGIWGALEKGDWKDPAQLGQVWLAFSGWAYGGGREGVQARETLEARMANIEVAVKNQDNREHDIFDSDDYFQDHGGMVAAARSLGGAPQAMIGDSSDPLRPRVSTLAREAAKVARTRVLNPKWIEAMRRHGYKGAFEMTATVDYLFGYDATTGVVEDWVYEQVVEAFVADPRSVEHFQASNPWALGMIAARLMEASNRGLWNASEQALEVLRDALIRAEGWEESR